MHKNSSIAAKAQNSPSAVANEVATTHNAFDPVSEPEINDRFPIQFKLSLGAVDDPLEHEADAMADKVMRMPETSFVQRKTGCGCCDYDDEHVRLKSLSSQTTPFIQAKGDGAGMVSDSVSNQIKSSMGGGSAIDPGTRSFMENRFGANFGGVKIHNNAESEQLNRSLNAKAFTVSNNIYFNNGQYQPETSTGKHLLAHELTHVVQQDSKIRRQPNAVGQAHPMRTYTELMMEFYQNDRDGHDGDNVALMGPLLNAMPNTSVLTDAHELMDFMFRHKQFDLVERLRQKAMDEWQRRFAALNREDVPQNTHIGVFSTFGPESLIDFATNLANANDHNNALPLFVSAFIMLQIQLITLSDKRLAHNAATSTKSVKEMGPYLDLFRMMSYHDESYIIERMKFIANFYSEKERQAIIQNNTPLSERMQALNLRLRGALRNKVVLSTTDPKTHIANNSAITVEGTVGNQNGKAGFMLHGVNQRDEFLTPLAGTPRPDQLDAQPSYTTTMHDMLETIIGQDEFTSELYKHASIKAAFGKHPIDLGNRATRERIWVLLYNDFLSQPYAGCPNAFCSLLRFIEKYLTHFTTHTEYNFRDFGKNYLDTTFPTDLLGRAMQDCGVYAVTVAYELYHTFNKVTPHVKAIFQLYHTMDHAMLAIADIAHSQLYLVSNNQITGPNAYSDADSFDSVASGTVGKVYGRLMKIDQLFSNGGRTGRVDTGMNDKNFHDGIWQRYQTGARMYFNTDPATPGDTRTAEERKDQTPKHYYDQMKLFNIEGGKIHQDVTSLLTAINRQPAQKVRLITYSLPGLTNKANILLDILRFYTVNDKIVVLGESPDNVKMDKVFFLTGGVDNKPGPLVRVAEVFLLAQHLGIALTPEQQNIINIVQNLTILPYWGKELKSYIDARFPLNF